MRRLQTVFLASLMLAAPALQAQLTPSTSWADPAAVDLQIEFPGQGYSAEWKLFRCDCGDLLVRSDLNVPGESVHGDLVLVEQQVVLSRGFGEYAEQGAASLDAAALMMQLALRLLQHTAPAGPTLIGEAIEVSHAEPTVHLHLDTGAAAGSFLAPWSVKGTVRPAGPNQRSFRLVFDFMGGTPEEPVQGRMTLQGLADFSDLVFPVDPETSLEDWKFDWRIPEDKGDAPVPQAATLSELRKILKQR